MHQAMCDIPRLEIAHLRWHEMLIYGSYINLQGVEGGVG